MRIVGDHRTIVGARAAALILLGLHATVDLLIWFTPLMFTAGFVLAAMTTFTEQSSFEQDRARS